MKKLSIVLLMSVAFSFSQNIYSEGITITERVIGKKLLEEQKLESDSVTTLNGAINDKTVILVFKNCLGFLLDEPFSCVTENFSIEENHIDPNIFRILPNCFPQDYIIPKSFVDGGIGILYIGVINSVTEGNKVYYSWIIKSNDPRVNGQAITFYPSLPDNNISCINRAVKHTSVGGTGNLDIVYVNEMLMQDEELNNEFKTSKISPKEEENQNTSIVRHRHDDQMY